MRKKCIITKGNCKGMMGYWIGVETVDEVQMALVEMDFTYIVTFPLDSIEEFDKSIDDK